MRSSSSVVTPGLTWGGDHFQNFGGQTAGDAHLFNVFRGFEGDGHTGSLDVSGTRLVRKSAILSDRPCRVIIASFYRQSMPL
ncbi:hypothetical protein TOC8171_01270 [Pseudomonas syringae]